MLLPFVTASRTNMFLTNLPWLHREHAFLHIKSMKLKLRLNNILKEISMQSMLVQVHDKRTKRKMDKQLRTLEKEFRRLAFH